ncbi:MAG: Unknown protein [uncultured Sulfurovum sp.]|uniref:Uncharacterized protein n=1 Tax=uncultured Sulfurovum sp. TaxID=269237 RepID=A0A6S6TUY7_9BACT|nr:MAG: Unknown protein [uncultured Sulfurovum sp.]
MKITPKGLMNLAKNFFGIIVEVKEERFDSIDEVLGKS